VNVDGKKVSAGGQNSIAVWTIDQTTGEPTLIQNADGLAIEMRTFAIDPSGRMLVAASVQSLLVRDGADLKMPPAGLSVFRIGGDGKLAFAREYDVDVAIGPSSGAAWCRSPERSARPLKIARRCSAPSCFVV